MLASDTRAHACGECMPTPLRDESGLPLPRQFLTRAHAGEGPSCGYVYVSAVAAEMHPEPEDESDHESNAVA